MNSSKRFRSAEELAEFVREAANLRRSLEIVGGGSKKGLGHKVDGAQISTTGLSGIELYEPEALTIVVKAGTPLPEVEKELATHGQHLPFEPVNYGNLLGNDGIPTIGGTVACGNSGSRRIQAGACRDSMIGVEFISGEGELIKNGGRVMKNVTGYDLVKLLTGSHGTLGIITSVSFKLLPSPQNTATLVLEELDDHQAVRAMSKALGSAYDLTGAAHLPGSADQPAQTCFRLEGFKQSVRYRAEALQKLLGEFGTGNIVHKTAEARTIWRKITNADRLSSKGGSLWKLSLKPGDAPGLVAELSETLDLSVLYDWGGGLVWMLIADAADNHAMLVRQCVDKLGGHATLIRPLGDHANIPIFHPQPAPLAKLSARLRRQFDPHAILNPGRMATEEVEPV